MDISAFLSRRTNSEFVIGRDDFANLEIRHDKDDFYYFYDLKENRLIKCFVLKESPAVKYVCEVTLIKKGDKFTPRIIFSNRDKDGKLIEKKIAKEEESIDIRSRIDLTESHENFWKLISFIKSIADIDIPMESFSLIGKEENDILRALGERDVASRVRLAKQLLTDSSTSLSESDIAEILNRRQKIAEFEDGLIHHRNDESRWQVFFEENKWIFGYGLDYQILNQEQPQPNYGGTTIDGTGGQRGDYLTASQGDLSFTVLVEIKTPGTALLRGTSEMRNGAWSLSQPLTDAVSQIEANIDRWAHEGSRQMDNLDRLEGAGIYTVHPKGIIVIGCLGDLGEVRSKRETFQRFRRSMHGIEIITFDELLVRARFIAHQSV